MIFVLTSHEDHFLTIDTGFSIRIFMLCQIYSADPDITMTLNDTAIIDLFDGSQLHHLTNYADLPKSFYGATGAFIKNKMLVCGGLEGASYCKKSTRGRGC